MNFCFALVAGFLVTAFAATGFFTDFDLVEAAVALVDFDLTGDFLATGFLPLVTVLVVLVFALVDLLLVAMHLSYHRGATLEA